MSFTVFDFAPCNYSLSLSLSYLDVKTWSFSFNTVSFVLYFFISSVFVPVAYCIFDYLGFAAEFTLWVSMIAFKNEAKSIN